MKKMLNTLCLLTSAFVIGTGSAYAGDEPPPLDPTEADPPSERVEGDPPTEKGGWDPTDTTAGDPPTEVLVADATIPDGPGYLYIAPGSGDHVTVVDLSNDAVATFDVLGATGLDRMARSFDHRRLYITSTKDDAVFAVRLSKDEVFATAKVGNGAYSGPWAIAVEPGDDRVMVADVGAPELTTLDAKSLAVLATETVPNVVTVGALAYPPNYAELYAGEFSFYGQGTISTKTPILNIQQGGVYWVWSSFQLPKSSTNDDGNGTAGIAFLSEQGLVVASNSIGDEVAIFDDTTHAVLATASMPSFPEAPVVDPSSNADQGRFFVVSVNSGKITVFDVKRSANGAVTLTVEATLDPPCLYPSRTLFADDPAQMYVLCNGEIAVLDAKSLDVDRIIDTNALSPHDFAWAKL